MSIPENHLPELPHFDQIKPDHLLSELKDRLSHYKIKMNQCLGESVHTFDNLINPLEALDDDLNRFWSPISHLNAVMESDALRAAYHECLPILTEHHTELMHHTKLYEAHESIRKSADWKLLNHTQQAVVEHALRDFKLNGVHLDETKKKELASLEKELSELTTKFSDHLLDATHAFTLHVTDETLLAGLPETTKQLTQQRAKEQQLPGYLLTLDFPVYSVAIKSLNNRTLRKALYEAYSTRASDQGPHAGKFDNSDIMNRILACRHRIAKLIGFKEFATYTLQTKMAKDPNKVLSFLNTLLEKSLPYAKEEMHAIEALAKHDDIDTLEAWDVSYYSEKLRVETYAFSPESLRPYFPIQKVLNGLFYLVNQLFGLNIREEANINTWHSDVRYFSILDADNHLRGGCYFDLYARPHKRDGAWMDDCQSRRALASESPRPPVAYLTCNFMQPVGDKPALLTHDDVLTLFHEFGHCLHHLLTQVDYPSLAGINGIPWDAVEFPSQFMEFFAWEKPILDACSEHYETKAPIPADLFEQMIKAKYFQTGMHMVRQLEFSLFDFLIHYQYDNTSPSFIQDTLNDVRKKTGLYHVPSFNRFQHSFSHIFAGGYAACYYSYKWAEVLSADAFIPFLETPNHYQALGKRYLASILEVGGTVEPMDAFIRFREQEPNINSLLSLSGMTPFESTYTE